jgi:hypothetical protein
VRKNLTNNYDHKKNQTINGADAERYFAVEAARGYIVISREYDYTYLDSFVYLFIDVFSFKDQIEGARLLSLLAQTNSWPASIFTELKYVNTNVNIVG